MCSVHGRQTGRRRTHAVVIDVGLGATGRQAARSLFRGLCCGGHAAATDTKVRSGWAAAGPLCSCLSCWRKATSGKLHAAGGGRFMSKEEGAGPSSTQASCQEISQLELKHQLQTRAGMGVMAGADEDGGVRASGPCERTLLTQISCITHARLRTVRDADGGQLCCSVGP